MANDNKHHFVPILLLKRWQRTLQDKLTCFNKNGACDLFWPNEIGFENGLYGNLEDTLFKRLDNDAGAWLDRVGRIKPTGSFHEEKNMLKLKRAWAEFVLFMIIRNPLNLKKFREKYKKEFPDLSDQELKNITLEQLPSLIGEKPINDLVRFAFCFSDFRKSKQRLIISDNPVIFKPNNLLAPKCRIILPLGPDKAFIAIRTDELIFLEPNPTKLVRFINREEAQQANQCLYTSSKDDVCQKFLENNFYTG